MTGQHTTHHGQMARLNRIEGQVRGIKRMIEEERYCVDILIQLRSVIHALCSVRDNIFRHHLEGCVRSALTGGDRKEREEKVEELLDLLSKFQRP